VPRSSVGGRLGSSLRSISHLVALVSLLRAGRKQSKGDLRQFSMTPDSASNKRRPERAPCRRAALAGILLAAGAGATQPVTAFNTAVDTSRLAR